MKTTFNKSKPLLAKPLTFLLMLVVLLVSSKISAQEKYKSRIHFQQFEISTSRALALC
jgi:hypothetical protein